MIPQIRWPNRKAAIYGQIDLGDGTHLPAEDVLDGHLRRLFRRRTVQVQTDDSLHSAITVLAPDLTPLTDLAEDLVDVVTDVSPEPQFRQDLHRALELTHRQHAAQRTLGTQSYLCDEEEEDTALYVTLGLLFLATLTLLFWGHWSRRTPA